MAEQNAKAGHKQQKVSTAQRQARIEAAQRREAEAAAKKEKSAKFKKILTVVVCVILVLALGIPTMALTVLSSM